MVQAPTAARAGVNPDLSHQLAGTPQCHARQLAMHPTGVTNLGFAHANGQTYASLLLALCDRCQDSSRALHADADDVPRVRSHSAQTP